MDKDKRLFQGWSSSLHIVLKYTGPLSSWNSKRINQSSSCHYLYAVLMYFLMPSSTLIRFYLRAALRNSDQSLMHLCNNSFPELYIHLVCSQCLVYTIMLGELQYCVIFTWKETCWCQNRTRPVIHFVEQEFWPSRSIVLNKSGCSWSVPRHIVWIYYMPHVFIPYWCNSIENRHKLGPLLSIIHW